MSSKTDNTSSIAIVLLTFNRLELLRQCVENVLSCTSPATGEIVIWDNGSNDGTEGFLASLSDPRVRLVRTGSNVGMVAYGRAFALTSSPYLIQLDDDVVDAPDRWDATLLEAFERLHGFGYLATDVEDDPTDRLSHERHRVHRYDDAVVNGVRVLKGPTGGWCTITSRSIYDEVGGLPTRSRQTYFSTDTVYVHKLREHGYEVGILPSLRVTHRGDRLGSRPAPAKEQFFRREERIDRLKDAVKRVLLLVPGMRSANARRGWFHEPGKRT
jgi:GT2 family glycosyltransferase